MELYSRLFLAVLVALSIAGCGLKATHIEGVDLGIGACGDARVQLSIQDIRSERENALVAMNIVNVGQSIIKFQSSLKIRQGSEPVLFEWNEGKPIVSPGQQGNYTLTGPKEDFWEESWLEYELSYWEKLNQDDQPLYIFRCDIRGDGLPGRWTAA